MDDFGRRLWRLLASVLGVFLLCLADISLELAVRWTEAKRPRNFVTFSLALRSGVQITLGIVVAALKKIPPWKNAALSLAIAIFSGILVVFLDSAATRLSSTVVFLTQVAALPMLTNIFSVTLCLEPFRGQRVVNVLLILVGALFVLVASDTLPVYNNDTFFSLPVISSDANTMFRQCLDQDGSNCYSDMFGYISAIVAVATSCYLIMLVSMTKNRSDASDALIWSALGSGFASLYLGLSGGIEIPNDNWTCVALSGLAALLGSFGVLLLIKTTFAYGASTAIVLRSTQLLLILIVERFFQRPFSFWDLTGGVLVGVGVVHVIVEQLFYSEMFL